MSDIDIARKAKKIHIRDVASKINIPEENLIPYGHDIAKIDFDFIEKNMSNPDGKLILVTDAFENMTLVKRHQEVYKALGEVMNEIHALSMHLYDLKEFKTNPEIIDSPDCVN